MMCPGLHKLHAGPVQANRLGEEIPNVDPHLPVQIVAIAVLEIPHLSLIIQSLNALCQLSQALSRRNVALKNSERQAASHFEEW